MLEKFEIAGDIDPLTHGASEGVGWLQAYLCQGREGVIVVATGLPVQQALKKSFGEVPVKTINKQALKADRNREVNCSSLSYTKHQDW